MEELRLSGRKTIFSSRSKKISPPAWKFEEPAIAANSLPGIPSTLSGCSFGPFQVDHCQYVFGNERPRPNRNQDAGIDISPAARDYLGKSGMDVCDWKFVSAYEVPSGPWTLYGGTDAEAHLRRQTRVAIGKR